MATTFCTSGAVMNKAGHNVDPAAHNFTDEFINQAESHINVVSRFNWTDAFAGLNSDAKLILERVASSLAAIDILARDISGSKRVGLEDNINIQRDTALQGLSLLKKNKFKDFINGA